METTLLLLIIGFIVLVFLIFKFIKKAIFAVIAIVAILVLIFGGTIGLVYLDMNNLANSKDYDVQVVLEKDGEYILGASLPVKNKDIDIENLEGITRTQVSKINVSKITDDDNLFVIEIEQEFLEEIMVEEYRFEGIDLPDEMADYDISLTKQEILELMDEGSTPEEMIDIILSKNNLNSADENVFRELLVLQVENYLKERNMNFRTAVFVVALTGSLDSEVNILKIIQGYKEEGKVEIYPDRLTFSLVRMLPASTIMGFLGMDNK